MRTPWRFVADLVSRKPKADLAEAQGSDREEIEALEYTPVAEEAVPEVEAVSAGTTDRAETEHEPDLQVAKPIEIPEPPAIEPKAEIDTIAISQDATPPILTAINDAAAPTAPANSGIEAGSGKSLRAARKPSASSSRSTADAPVATGTTATSEGPQTFVEEMAALDLEVTALRRQLAEKLKEQNVQLRKMIARFEKR
jgi:hypothetical protein